jgi:hypothetical protein
MTGWERIQRSDCFDKRKEKAEKIGLSVADLLVRRRIESVNLLGDI